MPLHSPHLISVATNKSSANRKQQYQTWITLTSKHLSLYNACLSILFPQILTFYTHLSTGAMCYRTAYPAAGEEYKVLWKKGKGADVALVMEGRRHTAHHATNGWQIDQNNIFQNSFDIIFPFPTKISPLNTPASVSFWLNCLMGNEVCCVMNTLLRAVTCDEQLLIPWQ